MQIVVSRLALVLLLVGLGTGLGNAQTPGMPVVHDQQGAQAANQLVQGAAAIRAPGRGDWPQFRGPNRDSLSSETGLMDRWPESGLKLLWKLAGLGRGYSGVSISAGRLFTMGDRSPQGKDSSQFVMAYDLASRAELWATRIGPPHDDGPRATPTVDGPRLYTLGTAGDLVCLDSATGKTLWQKNLVKDFGGKMMSGWRYSESPLVDGDRLICTPGGKQAALVALEKQTGKEVWRAALPDVGQQGSDGAGYSSAIVAEIGGVRQYIQLMGRGLVGVAADTGRFLWGYNAIASDTANIPTPLVRRDLVFASNAYGMGSASCRLSRRAMRFKPRRSTA